MMAAQDHAVSIAHIVTRLNEVVAIDRKGVTALLDARVPCNGDLASHPSVQVWEKACEKGESCYVFGFLGMMNGFFETDSRGRGPIQAVVNSDTGEVVRFRFDDDWEKYE